MVSKKSKKSQVLRELFLDLAKTKKYWNYWRTAEQWTELLNSMYPEGNIFMFTKTDLSRLLSVDPVLKHCFIQYGLASNPIGVYFDRHKKKGVRTVAIYCCAPNTEVQKSRNDAKWWDDIATRTPSLRCLSDEKENSTVAVAVGDGKKHHKVTVTDVPAPERSA